MGIFNTLMFVSLLCEIALGTLVDNRYPDSRTFKDENLATLSRMKGAASEHCFDQLSGDGKIRPRPKGSAYNTEVEQFNTEWIHFLRLCITQRLLVTKPDGQIPEFPGEDGASLKTSIVALLEEPDFAKGDYHIDNLPSYQTILSHIDKFFKSMEVLFWTELCAKEDTTCGLKIKTRILQ